jgi:hypothetical protein
VNLGRRDVNSVEDISTVVLQTTPIANSNADFFERDQLLFVLEDLALTSRGVHCTFTILTSKRSVFTGVHTHSKSDELRCRGSGEEAFDLAQDAGDFVLVRERDHEEFVALVETNDAVSKEPHAVQKGVAAQ